MIKSRIIFLTAAFFLACSISAQEIHPPLDFDLFLAGNYGELRPNHFHGGLDFKTQQTIGHPVHAAAEGYVERVGINAYGYGLVLYVTHPTLQRMTVYGHLSDFSEKIWEKLRPRQVADELNNADVTFAPGEIPVEQGEVIALSGNTGSSGGPHVHFEVRGLMSAPGADDENWYDPMQYFIDKIKDTTAPRISNLYLYTNPNTPFSRHRQVLNRTANAWGRIGFGIKAYDYMDGQANRFGVKRIKLFCDDKLIFNWNQLCHQYHENKLVNQVIDSLEWFQNRSTIMKTFVAPGNGLRMIDQNIGDGTVVIDEERTYLFRYELEDAHGNRSTLNFSVRGVPSAKAKEHSEEEISEALAMEQLKKKERKEREDSVRNAVLAADSVAPLVSIVGKMSAAQISFSLSDRESGVQSWKLFIDGQFVPSDMNNRGRIVGHPEKYGILPGRHDVEIRAYDKAGNEKVITLSGKIFAAR